MADPFDDPGEVPEFGPVFIAIYDSDDACCGYGIEVGDQIRADGQGGYIHAEEDCEKRSRKA